MININRSTALMLLRISLGIVFVWFGALKLFAISPVAPLIQAVYPSFPYPATVVGMGILEVVIGLGFLFNKMIKATVGLMWLQMLGIFGCFVIAPHLFFNHKNLLLLTSDGEFIIKNLVFLAASLVVLTHRE